MKIQSIILLTAMVGSVTAANQRKRVFRIYSRGEIAAAEGRVLQGGNDRNEPEPAAMSMSMTMSPSGSPTAMSMMTKCSFCHGLVIPVPDFELIQGQTCGSVKAGVAKLDATNPYQSQLCNGQGGRGILLSSRC